MLRSATTAFAWQRFRLRGADHMPPWESCPAVGFLECGRLGLIGPSVRMTRAARLSHVVTPARCCALWHAGACCPAQSRSCCDTVVHSVVQNSQCILCAQRQSGQRWQVRMMHSFTIRCNTTRRLWQRVLEPRGNMVTAPAESLRDSMLRCPAMHPCAPQCRTFCCVWFELTLRR